MAEESQMKSDLYHSYLVEENGVITNVLFISKNENNPNTELNEKINQGFFISDEIFVYSIKYEGIYAINVITKDKTTLVTGKEEFKLEEFKDNILKYDDKQISLIME